MSLRREEAERDPERRRDDHGGERELERRWKALLDLVPDLAVARDRGAEVEVDDRLEVGPVLDVDRLVEPVAMAVRLHERGRRALAEERLRRAPRQRVDPEEDQDRHAEQDRDEEQQSPDDVPEHL